MSIAVARDARENFHDLRCNLGLDMALLDVLEASSFRSEQVRRCPHAGQVLDARQNKLLSLFPWISVGTFSACRETWVLSSETLECDPTLV